MNRYAWNRSLIEPFTSMSLTGIPYDAALAASMKADLTPQAWSAQAVVDELAGVVLPDSTEGLLRAASEQCCHKVRLRKQLKGYAARVPALNADGTPKTNKKGRPLTEKRLVAPRPLDWKLCQEVANQGKGEVLDRLRSLAEGEQSTSVRAEIASLLGVGVNVKSNDQMIETLDRLGFPAKWKRGKHDPEDPDSGRTAAEEALLGLFIQTGKPLIKAVLEARSLRTALSWLEQMETDADGRVRCQFSNPGSETGRVLTKKWYSGSGGNLQAVTAGVEEDEKGAKDMLLLPNFRKLLRADPGHLMAQCDLKGADGWTVAARCASFGDRTMIDDLRAGIRIPSLLSLLMGGASFPSTFDRAELRSLCKAVVKDWRDYAFKKAQHLSNYMGSAGLIQRETVRESWSATGTPLDPGLEFCKRVQALYLTRYWGLRAWWNDVERQVRRNGTLEGASGQVREFLSRRWSGEGAAKRLDHSTHKEVIASEPQMVTTYATNLALWRLWSDSHNWTGGAPGRGTPYVQPLLHIHDALLVQFPEHLVAPAGKKLAEWFSNPIRIGNVTVSIPVESAYGDSWGNCKQPFPL